MAFSPDGSLLAGCSRGCHEVRVWDTSSWELKFELVGHTHNRNESVTFSPDGTTIATGGNDGTVRLWSAETGEQQLVFEGHEDKTARIAGLDFHPDGERIVSADTEREILIWNRRTGEILITIKSDDYHNYAGFVGRDGSTLATDHSGILRYWNADTGEAVETITAISDDGDDQHILFGGANQSRDRSTIVTAGWKGNVCIWDALTREETCRFKLPLE